MGEAAQALSAEHPAPQVGVAINPAELAQRLRAKGPAGFSGRKVGLPDAGFRAARMDQVHRLDEPSAVDPPDAEVLPAPSPAPDPAVLLAEAKADARAEGHADGLATGLEQGRAEGRAEAERELSAARDAFLAAARAVTTADATPDGLAALLTRAVHDLAAQRAGQAIDMLPEPFVARIATLADRVAQGMRAVTLRLSPDDLAVITPHLSGTDLDGATLTADPRLKRGDVIVQAEGITLSDLLDTP